MATSKFLTDPAIAPLTTPSKNDIIHAVDVSDTTDNPAGTSKQLELEYIPSAIPAEIKTAYESNADTNAYPDADAAKVVSYPVLPETPVGDYLKDDGTFKPIVVGSGNYAANLYLSNEASATSGYKKLSYTPDVAEVTKTITANNNTVQGEKYLFDDQIGITAINPGTWTRSFSRKVDTSVGVSTFTIRAFAYTIGGVENDLFTITSAEIDNETLEILKAETTRSQLSCNATDRFGIQISFTTTRVGDVTLSYLIGDGDAAYLLTPLAPRHSALRQVNEDPEVQHMTSTEQAAVGTIGKTATAILSTNTTLTAAQCTGGVFFVTGTTSITLPALVTGMSVVLVVDGTSITTVIPDGTEIIRLDGTDKSAGGSIDSLGISSDTCVLTGYDTGKWAAITNGWV